LITQNIYFDTSRTEEKAMAKPIRRFTVTLLCVGTVLVLLEGQFDIWLALYLAGWSIFALYAFTSIDDDLAKERFHPPEPGADRIPLRAIRLIALGHLVIGALDAGRWHLAPVPGLVRAIALPVMVGSALLVVQSMRANRFFSPVVRIQSERGHRVIDRGPYGTIRHPGYLGMIVSVMCSGLVLGSWLGFALAAVYAALILRRVFFEDAFLKVNLAGYADYSRRVPYRLIPGGW
jgi:protein-S-isoprenylcysteine O-methyltransferase Ste14